LCAGLGFGLDELRFGFGHPAGIAPGLDETHYPKFALCLLRTVEEKSRRNGAGVATEAKAALACHRGFATAQHCILKAPMTSKKKLLVLAGAGASVDFGMPNVNDVSKILAQGTRERFPLLFDQSRGLFEYFEDQLAEHWRLRGRLSSIERPTFENVLLAMTAGALDDKGSASPSTAFLSVRPFPDLGFDRSSRVAADDNVIREFGAIAVDSLLAEFRGRCLNAERDLPANFAALRGLVSALAEEFELSFATLNYDDVLYRCAN
jgi:hypothetical protein